MHNSKLRMKAMASRPLSSAETATASLETGEQAAKTFAGLFAESWDDADAAVSLVDSGRGRWTVTIHFRDEPDRRALRALAAIAIGDGAARALTFARVAAKDWVRESLAGLPPVAAGRFVVHGAHDRARVAPSRIGIEIEAALAFGTGHHGTTRGCLLAFDRICKASHARHILDLGTGSGVLAIAAAHALRQRVLASDIDAEAVRVARANARLNRAGDLVRFVTAPGVNRRAVKQRAPFDLIFANILLEPLLRFAAPLRKLIAPGGRIILSGLLAAQANAAIAAYRPLALERRIDIEGWATLVFVRRRS